MMSVFEGSVGLLHRFERTCVTKIQPGRVLMTQRQLYKDAFVKS